MTIVTTRKQKNSKSDIKQVTWNSATEQAFMRLSSILTEIIHSDNEGDKNCMNGGGTDVQMKKRSEKSKK